MDKRKGIIIKTADEIEILREAGKILASIVEEVCGSLKAGMTTAEIDRIAEDLIQRHQVLPAFKGYRGFPACACISVNEQVVHGIPGDREVVEGDLVSLDIGIIYKEFYSDTAVTVPIGRPSEDNQALLETTRASLMKGIEQARSNQHLSDISHAIQTFVEERGFSIVRDFVGHGIGQSLHEEPEIPNFGPPHEGPVLKPGMVMAIEPMVNLGDWRTKICEDGWTVVTADGKPSAHFEHSIVILSDGPEILTARGHE